MNVRRCVRMLARLFVIAMLMRAINQVWPVLRSSSSSSQPPDHAYVAAAAVLGFFPSNKNLLARPEHCFVLFSAKMKRNGDLICTQIIFRHGSRTPLFTLDDRVQERNSERGNRSDPLGYEGVYYDPDQILRPIEAVKGVQAQLKKLKGEEFTKSISDWWLQQGRDPDARLPGGAEIGVLTSVGQKQLFDLGQRIAAGLKQQHPKYARKITKHKSYRLRSTYFERTVNSAKSFMAGFLKELDCEQAKIEIEVDNIFEECLFPNAHFTSCLNRSVGEFYADLPKDHPFIVCKEKFLKLMGIPKYEYGILELTDEPSTRLALGLPMSPQLTELYLEGAAHLAEELIAVFRGRMTEDDFIRLAVGRLLLLFKTNFEKAVEQTKHSSPTETHPDLFAFAAHDNTICVLSLALGMYAKRWPWFSSFIMMQLFAEKKELYVRITYDDDVRRSSGWREGKKEEIVTDMKLDDFYKHLEKYAIDDKQTTDLDQKLKHKYYGGG